MRGDSSVCSLIELTRETHSLGYDSVWVGDSLLERPRHDPITVAANNKIYRSVAPAGGIDVTTALYLTIALDDNADNAQAMIDDYLAEYYGLPPHCAER